jgi:hypothetical protein
MSWTSPIAVSLAGFIAGAGNASITPTGLPLPGRFVQRTDRGGDPQVWWEDDAHTIKRRVGACEPCPGVNACGSIVAIPDAEFDALLERADFTCGALYNCSGYSHYYYPTLIDPTSTRDNFDVIGAAATLFLVGQRCVNAVSDGNGGVACSPFDDDGLLVRNLLSVDVAFS